MVRLAHLWSHDLGIPASLPFCEPLLARGWDITFYCPGGPHVAAALARGMRHVPLPLSGRRIEPIADARGSAALWRMLRRERYDVVHTHNIKVGLVGRVVAAAARAPVVVHTLHGLAYGLDTPLLKRAAHAAAERVANLGCDAILSQSEEDLRTLVESGGAPAEKLVWIGNGIDLGRFNAAAAAQRDAARAELGLASDDVLFLSAGRLVREKGFVELFEAAALARDRRVRVAVAGPLDPDKPDAIPADLLEAARANRVVLLGERRDMPRLYAAADVVTLLSWREGMPRVLMEGAAMGKCLLASDARGCREIVRSDANGVKVPVRDVQAIARALDALAGDPARRAAAGAHNAVEAAERYDIRKAVARVTAVYDRLLS